MKTNDPTADLFAAAFQQHQAGALREAEQAYKRVLALDPAHVDALHFLGVLAHQAGRSDIAAELIGRAISINSQIPESHYNLGLALGALNRFEAAAEHNRKAIGLKPDYAEAYLNLGNALKAVGKPKEAKSNYEKAIALKPQLAAAHFNLANVLSDEGAIEQALSYYEKALALRPNYAEALTNFGTVLLAQGRVEEAEARHRAAITLNPRLPQAYGNLGDLFLKQKKYDEAIDWYRKALALNPDYAEVHNNLGTALLAQEKYDEALIHCEKAFTFKPELSAAFHNFAKALGAKGEIGRALEIIRHMHEIEETAETRNLFATYLGDPRAIPFANRYRDILIRAISEGWGNPRGVAGSGSSSSLVQTILSDVQRNRSFVESLEYAMRAWPSRPSAGEFFGANGLAEIAKDDLLRCLLSYERLDGVELEQFLSCLRSVLLQIAMTSGSVESGDALSLFSALARQCFNNEYVFSAPEQEQQAAALLRDGLEEALSSGKTLAPLQVVTTAAYFPLHKLAGADLLLQAYLPAELEPLLKQQILEPKEERDYRGLMPCLTPIEDRVSQKVQAQYEENPYPRWVKTTSRQVRRMKIDEFMRMRFPLAPYRELSGEIDYLIAGCGTGNQVAGIKTYLDVDRILAIDLSLASLGYAKRMANNLGLTGVEFGQADILQLQSLGRTFDVVDSSGVLHHLGDPEAGWRVLEAILRPGGLMRIGLYSELARQSVVLARQEIAARGYGQSAEEIRRFRQEIIAMDKDAAIRKVVHSQDFFSLSECRDLLFHVQEHRFTLPRIAKFLNENGLVFLGFDLVPKVVEQYTKRFPEDEAATNLDLWDQFEQENSGTFVQMYQFWVQKAAAEKNALAR